MPNPRDALPPTPQPGELLLGKYRIERELGVGGMGVVLAATHEQLGQRVAIKLLRAELTRNDEVRSRFRREAQVAARIKSRYVTRVQDVGELDDGGAYMIMEYHEGEDLKGVLARSGKLPVATAVDYVLQAAAGLAEAHDAGVVHRDLKPANLFLAEMADGSREIRVLDFGVSKLVTEGGAQAETLTRTSALLGSPLYMSPEQMRSAKNVDRRADIWALGAILYELCTGRRPFEARSVLELASKILLEEPMPVRELVPSAPAALARCIERCMRKDRDARYADVAELAADLAALAGSDGRDAAAEILPVAPSAVAPTVFDDAGPVSTTVPFGASPVVSSSELERTVTDVAPSPTKRRKKRKRPPVPLAAAPPLPAALRRGGRPAAGATKLSYDPAKPHALIVGSIAALVVVALLVALC